jgi:CRP-like cAMP-binding protein
MISKAKSGVANGNRGTLRNSILQRLPQAERALILSKAEYLPLPARTLLVEMGQPIEMCYFMNSGVASIIRVMSDGKSVEVGLAGREGFVGLPLIVGYRTSPIRAIIQISGGAYRLGARDLLFALPKCPRLEVSLQRYAQELSLQAIQVAACNRLHDVDQRLARWLLMSHDRIGEATFSLTQEFISHMLGTRRASVTVAAGILQRKGFINYTRGRVTIKDREGLEAVSCECYEGICRQIDAWHRASRRAP